MSTVTYPPLGKPTSTDVAAVLRARTKDANGYELGDFTVDTRPTGTEVAVLIDMAYDDVTGVVGANLSPRCAGLATTMIIYLAAMLVEQSYWPEQVSTQRSSYAQLAELYTSGMEALGTCAGGELGAAGSFGMLNVYGWTSVTQPFGAPPA